MLSILLWFGCEEAPTPASTYKTTKSEIEVIDTASSEPGNTDPEDTATETIDAQKIYFKTTNISCSALDSFAVALTQVTPGGLEMESNDDNDVRNDLLATVDLEYFRTNSTSFLDMEKDDLNPEKGCVFSIELPTAAPGNLKDILLIGEDEESSDTGMWSFYAITFITNEKISCEDPTSTLMSCTLVPQAPLSQTDNTEIDPELEDGDIYVWMSDVFLSYTTGTLSPSLLGMGFQNGWNLAQVSGGTIDFVENLQPDISTEDLDLMPLSVTLSDLVPQYTMSASIDNDWVNVICDVQSEQCSKNQIGLRPSSWIVHGTETSSIEQSYKNLYYNGFGATSLTGTLQLQVWGIPSSEYYFSGEDISSESDEYLFFQQWGDFVDVAAMAPIVYDEGIYYPQQGVEAWASKTAVPQGAFCRGTERVIFVYYAAADEVAEALWYRLSGITPGWKILYGTQDQIETWRFMIASQTATTDYTDIDINVGCTVPDWQ